MSERGFLGERRLNLAELGGPVRRIIFTTYVVLLGLAIGVVVRERLPGYEIMTFGGYPTRSTIVFITAVTASLATAMLLAGAAHARTKWRYLLLAPIIAAIATVFLAPPAAHPGEASATLNLALMALPLPFIAACFAVVMIGPRLRTITTLAICLALFATFAGVILVLTWLTGTPYGPTAVVLSTGAATFALEPALLVVGFDLTEIGSNGVAAALRRGARTLLGARAITWGLVAIGMAASVGLALAVSHGRDLLVIWIVLLIIAVPAAGMIAARRPDRAARAFAELGYLPVLAVAIVVMLSDNASVFIEAPRPGYLTFSAARTFSLRAPAGMIQGRPDLPYQLMALTSVDFLSAGKRLPTLSVVGWPRPSPGYPVRQPSMVNDLLSAGRVLAPMPLILGAPDAQGWRRGEGKTTNRKGRPLHFFVLTWELKSADALYNTGWYLICGGRAADAGRVRALCETARNTFSTTPAEESSRPLAVAFSVLFLAAAAGVLGLAYRRSRSVDTAVLDFAAWVLLLTGARWMGGYVFGGVNEPLEDLNLAAVLLSALIAVAAIAAGALAIWPSSLAHRFDLAGARRLAAQALASLVIIAGLLFLYAYVVGRGERSQMIRGVVVVLALTWDLATAGATLNPAGEHHAFPRASRVLIFAGYLILVGTCVFMFGDVTLASGNSYSGFDTETIVANGLAILGGALVISRALRGIQALRIAAEPVSAEAAN